MLPKSYDKVSQETKMTVQQYIARATGFLQGKGHSDEEVRATMENIEKDATKEALEMALEAHEKRDKPCTAELFAQRFANLVWEAATGDDVEDWPYEFSTPVDSGPLAPDFLDAIGKTQIVALNPSQTKQNQTVDKDQTVNEDQVVDKDQAVNEEKTVDEEHPVNEKQTVKQEQRPKEEPSPKEDAKLPLPPEPVHEEPTTLRSAILNTLDAEWGYASREKKRKNGEPETPEPKRQRGNYGEKIPSGSSTQLPTYGQWSGIPLTAFQVQTMNAGLMEAIWEAKIYDGDNIYHDAGVFAVKIPNHKAWLVLGENIGAALRLACGSCTQKVMEEIVRYKSEELYNR